MRICDKTDFSFDGNTVFTENPRRERVKQTGQLKYQSNAITINDQEIQFRDFLKKLMIRKNEAEKECKRIEQEYFHIVLIKKVLIKYETECV